MATSSSGNTVGSTSSLMPTSWYVTDSDTKPATPGVVVVVIVGILSPIRILAFSRLRVRICGFASVLTLPIWLCRFNVADGMPMVRLPLPNGKSLSLKLADPVDVDVELDNDVESGVSVIWFGKLMPSSVSRVASTSST